jgi:hypothetical protein
MMFGSIAGKKNSYSNICNKSLWDPRYFLNLFPCSFACAYLDHPNSYPSYVRHAKRGTSRELCTWRESFVTRWTSGALRLAAVEFRA